MTEAAPPTGFAKAMETLRGRCVSCGFLAKHGPAGEGLSTYFEVELWERASGKVFSHTPDSVRGPVHTIPICFRSASGLGEEVIAECQLPDVKAKQEAAQTVFLKDRDCDQWFQYVPGLSPQQHLGGLAMQQLEQRQYEFQGMMEERRQKWERQLEDERRRFDLFLAAIVGGVATVGVVATIVGIFFS